MFILIMYVLTIILIAIVMEELWERTIEEPINNVVVDNSQLEKEFFSPVTVMQAMYYDKELAKETLDSIDINMTTDEIIAAISETNVIENVSFEAVVISI